MADSQAQETFGGLLKKLRLEEAKLGLRAFAELIDWKPSNLSSLERGRIPPPANRKAIDGICNALGLSKEDPRREQLFNLAAKARRGIPADVADAMREQPGIPVLVRAIANKRLDEDRLKKLTEYIKKFY